PSDAGGLWIRAGGAAVRVTPSIAVAGARRCTAVRIGDRVVSTVEHLLAAIAGTGAWNTEIEIEGPEAPILDGSALPWAEAIVEASEPDEPAPAVTTGGLFGASRLTAPRTPADHGEARYRLEPAEEIALAVRIGPWRAGEGASIVRWSGDPEEFLRDFAPARTYVRVEEIAGVLAAGLGRGGGPECVAVLGPDGPIGGPLRFPDEPARHKLIDLLGDLALLGAPIAARVTAVEPGHAANRALVVSTAGRG
ncbi:MAG: UDP-3-O-acyl-N-acetylglucosamine deacetylase, partial [Myxococcota bacterium]|nr:UDP-3-O-acyl-N-acetylglucosamine deacetylase [Myxococcota bacterium]